MAHRWMMKLLMWLSVPQTTRCTLPVQLTVASPSFLSWIGRGASLAVGPEKKATREGTNDGRVFGAGSKSNCRLLLPLILDYRIAGPIRATIAQGNLNSRLGIDKKYQFKRTVRELGGKNAVDDHIWCLLVQTVEAFKARHKEHINIYSCETEIQTTLD
ncbi:hypothetical protein VPH35_035321 [Triticum aestivum]|uniref:Secreted protein n=1 Tax=Aegilops tauschii subsp. strangulata TaxID=200361 RepID=A0A453AUL2_AEGTS